MYSEEFLEHFANEIARQVKSAVMDATASGTTFKHPPGQGIVMSKFIAYAKKAALHELGQGPPPWEKPKRSRKKKKTWRSR